MEKVQVTYDEEDELYLVLDMMDDDSKADDYCPSIEDLKIIARDLKKYYKFLVWIIETGYNTPDNEKNRYIIERMLKEYVEFVEPE